MKFFLMYVLTASFFANQVVAAERSESPGSRARSRKGQISDRTGAAASAKLEKRFDSLQAQLAHIVLMVNRNANDLKTIESRLNQQLHTGNEADVDAKKQIKELKARVSHQTFQVSESALKIGRQLDELKAQLSHHIIASNEQYVVDSSATGKRLDSITARLDHQTHTGNESARATSRQIADLKAQLSHQILADNERNRRIDDLDARVTHETIKGSEFAHKAARQLADLETRLNHQIVAANEQSHRIEDVETNVAQRFNESDSTAESKITLPSGTASETKPVGRKLRRAQSIEARLIRIIELLEQENRE